jgi:hypothetical protein
MQAEIDVVLGTDQFRYYVYDFLSGHQTSSLREVDRKVGEQEILSLPKNVRR